MELLLENIRKSKKILVHACCAPCLANPFSSLIKKFSESLFYFYNVNIHPFDEYLRRLKTARTFLMQAGFEIIEGEYNPSVYYEKIAGKEITEDRCRICYQIRLEKTAVFAVENGIPWFTTTLLSSPFQKHELVREEGRRIAELYDLKFIYYDLRKTYYRGVNQIRNKGLYYQWYCGCNFSRAEREKEKAMKLKEVRS